MELIKKNRGLLIVIAVSFFALKPLFSPGYFTVHDSLQVERIFEMSQALKDGNFPVRWVKDLGFGYGYPLFNFYAPLPYYIGSLFNILGFNLIVSTKIMFGLGILLSGISMYLFAREIWGEYGGVLSAMLYQYLPYHAVQIYVRGSVGEYWAYAFLPLLALALLKIIKHPVLKKEVKNWILLGIFSYAGIILSHNITAMIVSGFLIITLALHSAKVILGKYLFSTIRYALLIIIIGLSLSAFFWLPAFFEKDLTQVNKVIQGGSYYADHFVQLGQLWSSPWGYGGSAPLGKIDGMSFKLGKTHIMLAIISTLFILLRKSKQKKLLFAICYLLFAISVFMMLSVSKPIWAIFPILEYIQFPWRFLMFAGFSLSVLGGGTLYAIGGVSKVGKIALLLIVSFLVIANIHALPLKLEIAYFKPVDNFHASDENFTSEHKLKWDSSKRSDEYLPIGFSAPQNANQIALTRLPDKFIGNVKIAQNKTHMLSFFSNLRKARNIRVNIAYFPGWKVYIDGVEGEIAVLNRGFRVSIPSGMHKIVIKFEDTKVRKIANSITLLSLLFISGIFVGKKWLYG